MDSKTKGLNIYLIVVAIPLTIISLAIGRHVYSSEKILIPISVFALMAGLFFEYRRITHSWKTLLGTALSAFVFSFFAFLPGKHESNYVLDMHIEFWPYTFCFVFIIIAIVYAGKKIVTQLTEGITLMQSIAVIYWIADVGFVDLNTIRLFPLIFIGFYFAAISIYNAFSYDELTKKTRLTLSIWSSVVMLLFSVDNIYTVYQNQPIETVHDIYLSIFIALQFFLLGISSIYIVQNYFMLSEFLPGKHRFFNDQYFKDIARLKKTHIERYSPGQVKKIHSFICVLITGTIFGLNYYFKFLPRNFVIWSVFVLFPIGLNAFSGNKNESTEAPEAGAEDRPALGH